MSQAGKFRERITIYQPSSLTKNEVGGWVPGVETSFELPAQVETLVAKEVLANNQLVYKQPYRITIRFTDQLSNIERVEWRGISIAINSIVQDERRTEKILLGYASA